MIEIWDNPLDLAVIRWLGQYTMASAPLNQVLRFIEGANLFKGLPMMSLFWFYWFKETPATPRIRRTLLATLVGCMIGVLVARFVNNVLPFAPRPFANPALPHLVYAGLAPIESQTLFHLNSFPSDHATLFFGLALGFWLISKPMGLLVFAYTALFIALPRMYLGLHYTTDILAGTALGIGFVLLSTWSRIAPLYTEPCMRLLEKYPAAFQTGLFFITIEVGILFDDVRKFLQLTKNVF